MVYINSRLKLFANCRASWWFCKKFGLGLIKLRQEYAPSLEFGTLRSRFFFSGRILLFYSFFFQFFFGFFLDFVLRTDHNTGWHCIPFQPKCDKRRGDQYNARYENGCKIIRTITGKCQLDL